jgi:DoxX-like family
MLIAYIIVITALGLLLVTSAAGKLANDKRQITTLDRVGVPSTVVPWLATCEIAGAAGLVMGIAWIPLGIAASIGIIAYFLGAIVAHIRITDLKGTAPAIALLALGITSLVLAIARW